MHEKLAAEAASAGRTVTAAEANVRASIYYHYGKHLFADRPDEFRQAHEAMLRGSTAGATALRIPVERVMFPYKSVSMAGWLRKPFNVDRPPVAVVLPGLDACKEELHHWAAAFVERGVAALTLDGPGQGETSFHLPTTHEWGPVLGAVIDVLAERKVVEVGVGVVGPGPSARSTRRSRRQESRG